MKIDILTLFPDTFDFLKVYGVIGKAVEKNIIEINSIDIRKFSKIDTIKLMMKFMVVQRECL